ncbi:MAG: 1-acyl-sn-glycerol-3-phosphate acyltransferase [Alphaproteobacteria bacterium]
MSDTDNQPQDDGDGQSPAYNARARNYPVRSILFNIAYFGWTVIAVIIMVPILFLPHSLYIKAIRFYFHSTNVIEKHVLGLTWDLKGMEHVPDGPCIIAMKHQSMWETMKLVLMFPTMTVILKRELMWIPFWGWFPARWGVIPVDRGGKSKAVASIVKGSRKMAAAGRPIVIFPQGTRVPPGEWKPYRIGVYRMYEDLQIPVVPVAMNAGWFWPRHSFLKWPGKATVEVLKPIQPGLDSITFMDELERRTEEASDRLVMAVGGPPTTRPEKASPPGKPAQRESS